MILTFDIETLQTTDTDIIESLRQSIKPPATFKKPESIAEWMKENQESALADLVAKTSFDGMYGKIACIAWKFDDGEVFSTEDCHTEEGAINSFYNSIVNREQKDNHGFKTDNQLTFCGHNIAGFDLPFLKHRSIILGVKPPKEVLEAFSAKPWDKCIADTMLMWSSDSQKRASMDKLCKAFGLEGKGDFDGSMVNEAWTTGNSKKVIDYCKDDVDRTYKIYNRLTFK